MPNERKPTWFKKRMDDLGLSYEEVANAVDRDVVTIRTWEHRGYVPFQLHAIQDWQPLLDILKMSIVEVAIAVGHQVKQDYSPEQLNLLHRHSNLPARQQRYAMQMLEAVLTVCESTDLESP